MSRLNGVDISGYDEGIRIADVEADFIIVKATEGVQGTRYNPGYRQMADATLDTGRLLGFYHYANGGDPVAEADCLCDSIADYRGRAMACLDWEGQGNPAFESGRDVEWCEAFLGRVAERMGCTPLLYTGKYTCLAYDWSSVAARYPLWGAMYATDGPTYGYQGDPWQTTEPWGAWGERPLVHQYTGNLVLERNGGIEAFDGNVFYGDRSDWMRLCGGAAPQPAPVVTASLDYPDAIAEVAEHIAEHDAHGYSQPNRAGDGTVETIALSDGTTVEIHGGDYDCSEMARMCAAAAGVLPWDYWESYMWTGNEDEVLTSHGFVRYPFDWGSTQRGDILLVSGHTGIALGDGMQADARGDEHGGIAGPSQGDQTGREIEVRELQGYWTWTYRYEGPRRAVAIPTQEDEMYCTIHLNGDKTSDGRQLPMVYFDGQALHPIANEHELEAIRRVYSATHGGAGLPDVVLGDQENPFGSRLVALLKRTVWPYADPNEDLRGLV